MKKYTLFVLFVMILGSWVYVSAQTADGGIFGSGSTLTVKFKPSADITGTFTGGNFGIRWLTSLGAGVNLSGETGTFGYVNQGTKATSGSYTYIVYASTSSIASTTYTAGIEYTLMTVTVSGGVGTGSFELCPDGFASNAGLWYIELGGGNKANPSPASWYYQQTASNVSLPVELSSFAAKSDNNKVILNWETKTEVNNYGFDVERKTNNVQWAKVGFVNGNGNSNSPKEYFYVDKNPNGGSKFQYRLKQIDNDGQFEYSDIVEIEAVPNEYILYQNYPNPFNPVTNIRFAIPISGRVSIKLYNTIGEEVKEIINQDYDTGYHEVKINSSELASGIYLYKIVSNNFTAVKKLIIMK